MTIRTKLIASFLMAIVIAIGSNVAIVSLEAGANARQEFEESSQIILGRINDFMLSFFDNATKTATYMASSPDISAHQGNIPSFTETKEKRLFRVFRG